MLFPPSGDPPNAEVFDIILLHLLLCNICYLTAPSTGWHEMPPHYDDSPEANKRKRKVLKGERSFDTVLSYYEKSLEMLEHLGMDGHKETILTLKNCESCHSSNGNYEKARKFWERAERVAERELENDHRWKVMVKTQQALVFDKESKEDR